MDYSSATLIATAFGLGIMSLLAAGFGLVDRFVSGALRRSALHGAVFGSGAILVMQQPVDLGDGVMLDARAIIVGLAGAFGGWPAALLSGAITAAYRLHLGGTGALSGAVGIALAAKFGLIWAWRFKPSGHVGAWSLAGLGGTVSLCSVSVLLLPPPMVLQVATSVVPWMTGVCVLGAIIMGALIERERGHIRNEDYWKTNAHTDALTQLPNRRWFQDTMDAALSSSAEPATHALIVVDADHFKRVNDTYGHDAGDAALVFMAGILRRITRESDNLCRLGGEEFAVFVSDTSHAAATRIAYDFRRAVRDATFTYEDQTVPLSVSVGIVIRRTDATTTCSELFRAADDALYEAKKAGRNRVVFARTPERRHDPVWAVDAAPNPVRRTSSTYWH